MKKMIKRLAATFLSLLLLLSLAACGQVSDMEQKTEEDSGIAENGTGAKESLDVVTVSTAVTPYEELVERFYTLIADPYSIVDIAEYGEFGVIESARSLEDNALDGMGYTIEDLSGDGIPELVVGTLPEYGGQINAVYTSVDGQPQFVFEGWYRSSYSYLGDGRFYYYGSGGASETGQGSFCLSKDGTILNCEEFFFTHATGEDYSDLKVYYNTTGSWDIAASQESDMTLDMFWEWEPSYEELPLKSFADYAVEQGPEAPVQVHWAELWLNGNDDYEKFVADDGEYATDVLFTAKRSVTDFELMWLTIQEISEDGTVSYDSKPIYSLDRLMPERPLVVRMT